MKRTLKIHEKQMKIYKTAKFSKKKNKYVLKLKHLKKLREEVEDFVSGQFYWGNYDEVIYLTKIMTHGFINEVLEVLNDTDN